MNQANESADVAEVTLTEGMGRGMAPPKKSKGALLDEWK